MREAKIIDTARYQLVNLAYAICKPLARIFLKFGLGNQLIDVWKKALIDAAMEDGGIDGARPTKNRIAMLTGLSKKDTARLLQVEVALSNSASPRVTSKVLNEWTTQKRWLDETGRPRELLFDARFKKDTFSELCKAHSTSYTARTILDELVQSGSAEELPGGRCRFVRLQQVASSDVDRLAVGARHLVRLAETVHHNLATPGPQNRRYEQVVTNRYIDRAKVPQARARARELCTEFNAKMGSEMDKFGTPGELEKDTVGVGIFYIEEPIEQK